MPAAALACALTLAVAGCSGSPSARDSSGSASGGPDAAASAPASTTRAAAPAAATSELEDSYRKVINDVLPSVVQIEASGSLGSGVVYDDKGHVVTNAHVVGDRKTFRVTVANSEDAHTAKLVAAYPEQDLAVIAFDRTPSGLRPARFADSAKVEVGQIVLAMGSPLGLASSVTQGIVSATGRTVTEPRSGGGTGATIPNMLQTSAAINPGNSGGALVNLQGEVVGIPTLAATNPELGNSAAPGIGFAIPASTVRTVADQIIAKGEVTDSGRAALDIVGRTVLDEDFRPGGVAVVRVEDGGAADRAGIEPGDVIIALGDTDTPTITALAEALAERQPGARAEVTYVRDGKERTADVTLGEQ